MEVRVLGRECGTTTTVVSGQGLLFYKSDLLHEGSVTGPLPLTRLRSPGTQVQQVQRPRICLASPCMRRAGTESTGSFAASTGQTLCCVFGMDIGRIPALSHCHADMPIKTVHGTILLCISAHRSWMHQAVYSRRQIEDQGIFRSGVC